MKNDGGQAFPTPAWKRKFLMGGVSPLHVDAVPGMTLRDYFAAKAMQAMLANWLNPSLAERHLAANDAYQMADAMLKEREK